MRQRFLASVLLMLALCFGVGARDAAYAQTVTLPVPTVTIYPGDVIGESELGEREFSLRQLGSGYIDSRSMLLGKVARRTLLSGHPIPVNAVREMDLVTRGTMVRLVFQQAGLIITAFASPLEDGGEGDVIRLRNVDSGTTVVGVVQADGTVRVGVQ